MAESAHVSGRLTSEVGPLPVAASIDVGNYPYSATYDNGNGYVYVTNLVSGNVSVVNNTKLVGSVKVGSSPGMGDRR